MSVFIQGMEMPECGEKIIVLTSSGYVEDVSGQVINGVEAVPAADVVSRDCYDRLLAENDELRKERPVRRGRWTDGLCSECGCSIDVFVTKFYNFCPNCGADMRQES